MCGCESEPAPTRSAPPCDAGDEAWVKLTMQALLGRRPEGIREVRVLRALLARTDRARVVAVLQASPEWERRWVDFFMDEVRVNRDGVKNFSECFEPVGEAATTPALAAAVRDNGPESTAAQGATLADLLRSSLRLDDITPFYRAWLFGMLARPSIYCPNLSPQENDDARRLDFGQTFSATYLHRDLDCLPCHNAQFSPTAHLTAGLNRFWPLEGDHEAALWGASGGIEPHRGFALLRSLGVVSSIYTRAADRYEVAIPGGVRPWGLSSACGEFLPRGAVRADQGRGEGYFGGPRDALASVWDAEALLRQGVSEVVSAHAAARPTPASAFATLLARRVTHQVWRSLVGAPLTLGHGVPRNQAQRDTLQALSSEFIARRYSLRHLQRAIVLNPLFNLQAPGVGCGGVYSLPGVFDPWSRNAEDPTLRGNSPGDALVREDARTLLRTISHAMDWPQPASFPSESESRFQGVVGAFVSERRTGFDGTNFQQLLAWEDRFGACLAPRALTAPSNPVGSDPSSCRGRCNVLEPPEGGSDKPCGCDAVCAVLHDCCADFEPVCVAPAPPQPPDWLDRLSSTVTAWDAANPRVPLRLRDVVEVLKDRVVTEPDIDPEEAPLIAGLYGAASLDAPLASVPAWAERTRQYCGVLARSPQFLLRNVPAREQRATPTLVVGETTFRALCERWSAIAQRGGARALRCGDDDLTLD